jgi:hypothetical protein
MITPAISAALPAFQLVEDRERTPEPTDPKSLSASSVSQSYLNLDDSEDEQEITTQFILAPRTYTPVPSPRQASSPFQEPTPPPEVSKRSSLRKRLSLKIAQISPEVVEAQNDDDGYWGPRRPVFSVAENERQRANSAGANGHDIAPITVTTPQELEAITTPPSRGLDSAYCSDPEKAFSPGLAIHSALVTTSNSTPSSPYLHPSTHLITPPIARDGAASPRSELQYFVPVNASPHSPLQRPWTAAPTSHHAHHNSNLSNLSNGSNGSTTRFQLPPSQRPSNLRNMPSAMGMSTMTSVTYMTEGGTKKKKKGPFGWLKKAFALSEEEKAAFEARRRQADEEARYYEEQPKPKWIDGKRVR